MKEKFRYRFKHYRAVLIISTLLCMITFTPSLFLAVELSINNAAVVAFIPVILHFVYIFSVFYLFDNMPSRFKADRNAVEFRILFKKINIRYSNIKSIEVTHEYAKPQIRGDVGRYKEIIKFVCRDGEYRFENIMDIDFAQTAAAPESLSEQFERGKFIRLKNYISRQTGITY